MINVSSPLVEFTSKDLPFALTYLLDESGTRARLTGRIGIPTDHPAALTAIDVDDPDALWRFDGESGTDAEIVDLAGAVDLTKQGASSVRCCLDETIEDRRRSVRQRIEEFPEEVRARAGLLLRRRRFGGRRLDRA